MLKNIFLYDKIPHEKDVFKMFYTSTRDKSVRVTAAEAIAKGISSEGGLFVPTEIPEISAEFIEKLVPMTYIERAKEVQLEVEEIYMNLEDE